MSDWQSIESAPRDGTRVLLKGDDGRTFRGGFTMPCWWMIGPGVRIADDHLYSGDADILRAVQWRKAP